METPHVDSSVKSEVMPSGTEVLAAMIEMMLASSQLSDQAPEGANDAS